MKTFRVGWVKEYERRGEIHVNAYTRDEAYTIASKQVEHIGGDKQYVDTALTVEECKDTEGDEAYDRAIERKDGKYHVWDEIYSDIICVTDYRLMAEAALDAYVEMINEKPTDERRAEVEGMMEEHAEDLEDVTIYGQSLDETWSKKALLGAIKLNQKQTLNQLDIAAAKRTLDELKKGASNEEDM